jgi:hypothetical protein
MIEIGKSSTAGTRTCDFANTTKEALLESSRHHIGDVGKALAFFGAKLTEAAAVHDYDKLTGIDWFHRDFVTGFKETGWWDNHRKIHRHHLGQPDGVPDDVNLIDVIEFVADCVMAGMARSGSVYELKLPDELLRKALANTADMLTREVVVLAALSPSPDHAGGGVKRLKCQCPARCNYCGARRRRDAVGHYCPTKNCQWQHGYSTCKRVTDPAATTRRT